MITPIVNAVVKNLSAASALGERSVGKDYSVLEKGQSPAVVVGWKRLTPSVQTGFNGTRDRYWTLALDVYVKDKGSASGLMDELLTSIDKIILSLESDPTLQGTVAEITAIEAERVPGEAEVFGTVTYLPYKMEVSVTEWVGP